MKYNLRTVKAYLLREDFQRLWTCQTPGWADRFLKERTQRAMRSRIGAGICPQIPLRRQKIWHWWRMLGVLY
ncbi:MAG: hypothetical protein U0795_03280 [Pirellulales bacterium]